MSLSKVKSFNNNLTKDSFSHRVCDDLSEVILQFLSFEDKFRLECVSKQFQRTIFERHYELIITRSSKIPFNSFEIVLRKMANIRSLSKQFWSLTHEELELICKYSKYLVKIDCDFSDISNSKALFRETFGSKIKSFNAIYCEDFELFDNSLPLEVEELICDNLSNEQTSGPTLTDLLKVKFKNLKMFSIYSCFENNININPNINALKSFVKINKNITHLDIDLEGLRHKQEFLSIFKSISQLNQLISLKVGHNRLLCPYLIKGLVQLSQKCIKLKEFSIHTLFLTKSSPNIQMKQFMDNLKKFSDLKRLDLNINWDYYSNFNNIEEIINKSFNGFQNLTHLGISVDFFNYPAHFINPILFKDINIYLPKLQSLNINPKNKLEATEETAICLSQLKHLQSIELNVTNESIGDLIETQVIKNCPKIRKIETTIETTISSIISDDVSSGYSESESSDGFDDY